MDFTDEDRWAWQEQRRSNGGSATETDFQITNTCLHCGRQFGMSEGVVMEDVAICGTCL